MRIVLSLLALAGSCQLAACFAFAAAAFQSDAVGFAGLGIAGVTFVLAQVFIWRPA